MASFVIERVTVLPASGSRSANTVYLVAVGTDHTEMYVTGNAATTIRRIFNEADVQTLVDAAVSGIAALEIVNDIAARDDLTLTANAQVLVLDASADATVTSGAATYAYRHSDTTYFKVSESESLDVVLSWANLTGKPTSTAAEIDAAVSSSHAHANATQIDKIGQNADGDFTYDGREYVRSGAAAW